MADDPFAERNEGKVETRKMWRLPEGYPFYGYYLGGRRIAKPGTRLRTDGRTLRE
jgi:hypothetical protein